MSTLLRDLLPVQFVIMMAFNLAAARSFDRLDFFPGFLRRSGPPAEEDESRLLSDWFLSGFVRPFEMFFFIPSFFSTYP